MPLINKANAVSQLQTILSGVTVATEETTRLLALLETAKNAGLYSANVETELLTRIGSVSTSNTVTEVALRAKAADLVHFDRQLSTANLTTLNAFSANVGTIVYVDSEGVPYIRKNNNTWSFVDAVLSSQLKNAWSWGSNAYGQLGDNTTSNRSSPVSVVGGFTDWISLSGGGGHSLGLRANGTLWTWGRNQYGQLGDNTTSNRSSPVSVIGGFTDWISLSPRAANHSVALRANGTLWTWGRNQYGQLGDNTTSNRSSPVSVIGGFTDWTSVNVGGNHTLAIRANGTLWAWGYHGDGQLGNAIGIGQNRSSPTSVVGGFTDWISTSGGSAHSFGVRANGTLWSWGRGVYGRMGTGNQDGSSSPVSVIGGFTDWVTASGGPQHSSALRANGTAWSTGKNDSGQLGTGDGNFYSSPVSIVGGYTDWILIDTNPFNIYGVGLRSNGTLWAWGGNGSGQLGTNNTSNRSSPVSVVGGFADWIFVSPGTSHVLGLRGG